MFLLFITTQSACLWRSSPEPARCAMNAHRSISSNSSNLIRTRLSPRLVSRCYKNCSKLSGCGRFQRSSPLLSALHSSQRRTREPPSKRRLTLNGRFCPAPLTFSLINYRRRLHSVVTSSEICVGSRYTSLSDASAGT